MKKLWIGAGVSILIIAIGGAIAQKIVADFAAPIRVLTVGLCVMIVLAVIMGILGVNFDLKGPKGGRDKQALMVFLAFELIMLAGFAYMGVYSVRAIADIVNGPAEKEIYAAILDAKRHNGYRYDAEYHFMTCITADDKREKLKLSVSDEMLEEVDAVLKEAKWDYGLEAMYKVTYFENLDFLCDIQMIVLKNNDY